VVYFANQHGSFCGKDPFTAAKNGCLVPFDVDLNQVRRGVPADKIVDGDAFDIKHIFSSLRLLRCNGALVKARLRGCALEAQTPSGRPDGAWYDVNLGEIVPPYVFLNARSIGRVRFEREDGSLGTHKPRSNQT
jgi:hypothetical protein